MSEPAILSKEGDISTITLDDGKVNVFSLEMLESIQNCLCLLYTSDAADE